MSESGYGVARDGKLLNWEKNIFPVACDKCLGPQAYMRMLKKPLGNQCKVCERPYTSFHWKIGDNPRFKKTQICSTCAKINNCCQVCIFDLEFGLPIDIRNRIMGDKKVEIMMSEGNRDVFAALVEENVDKLKLPYRKLGGNSKSKAKGSEFPTPMIKQKPENKKNPERQLKKHVQTTEEKNELFQSFVSEISKDDANQIEIKGRRFNRANDINKPQDFSNYKNFAKYCSFWLKGECNRGKACPYIHAEPPKIRRRNPKYDIKNRYLGTEDPDEKLSLRGMQKARETLKKMGYLENEVLVYFVEEQEVASVMGKIKRFLGEDVRHEFNAEKMAAKVIFRDREKAEWCMKLFSGNLVVNGKRLNLKWIKDKRQRKRNMKGQFIEDEEGNPIEPVEVEKKLNQNKKKKDTKLEINKRDYEDAFMKNPEDIKKAHEVRGGLRLDRSSKVTIIPSKFREKRKLVGSGFDFDDFLPKRLPKTMNRLQKEKARKVFLENLDKVHDYEEVS